MPTLSRQLVVAVLLACLVACEQGTDEPARARDSVPAAATQGAAAPDDDTAHADDHDEHAGHDHDADADPHADPDAELAGHLDPEPPPVSAPDAPTSPDPTPRPPIVDPELQDSRDGPGESATTPPAQDETQPVENPRPPAPPVMPPDAAPIDVPEAPRVDAAPPAVLELLDRLARNDEGLEGFKARITYQKTDALLGRKETRTGEMVYHVDSAAGRRRFAALFDAVTIGARKRTQQKQYVFDGRWLAEIDHERKQFIKREVVPPGQVIDPLKLGEGPFPLPIGQPRDEVLRRFDVSLIEPPAEGLLKALAGDVDGILLTPRLGAPEAEEFRTVALYFDRATGLPVGSHIVSPPVDGESDESIVLLRDLVRNPALTPEELATLSIAEPDPAEWRIDVRPWGG